MTKPLALVDEPVVVPVVGVRQRSRWWMTLPLFVAVGALALVAWRFPPTETPAGDDTLRFAGRLHPMLTHLPIGLLILMPIMDVLGLLRRGRHLWASGQLVLWIATIGVIVASVAGYLFARYDGHAGEDVIDHQWAGIATAGACCVALLFRSLARGARFRAFWALLYVVTMAFTLFCMSAAGHLGGKLNYGNDFLTEYAPQPIRGWLESIDGKVDDAVEEIVPPNNLPATLPANVPTDSSNVSPTTLPVSVSLEGNPTLYTAIVHPIFAAHCIECHGEKKVKADLRLDTFAHAMRGGENESTIVAGSLSDSELVRLIRLPRDHDDAMPPSKNPAMTEAEIRAIEWWIQHGASDALTLADAKNLPADLRALAK